MKVTTALLTAMAMVILWNGETTNASTLMMPLSQYRQVGANEYHAGGSSDWYYESHSSSNTSNTSHWVASVHEGPRGLSDASQDSEILPQALKVSWSLRASFDQWWIETPPGMEDPFMTGYGASLCTYQVAFYLSESSTVRLRGQSEIIIGGVSSYTLSLSDQSGQYVFAFGYHDSPGYDSYTDTYDATYVLPEGRYTLFAETYGEWIAHHTLSASLSFCPTTAPAADLTGDCKVDFLDFAVMASQWFYGVGTPDGWGYILQGTVVVDGDISDWADAAWWPLDIAYYGAPTDVSSARFALKWNALTQKVYVFVEVTDSDHVFSNSYISWDASDRLEIYCQGNPVGGTGWGGIYDAAQQYYVAPGTSGNSWARWAYGQTLASDVGLAYAIRVTGDKIVYEAAVSVFENYGGFNRTSTVLKPLAVDAEIGFDIVACTRHSVGFGMLSGNELRGKSDDASKFARYRLK
jgi:hypothetical protein